MDDEPQTLDDVDLFDPDRIEGGPPFGMFDLLLRKDPVHWHGSTDHPAMENEEGFWAVVKYRDVKKVSRNWETFSSEPSTRLLPDNIPPRDRRSMINLDPPDHTRLRRAVNDVFGARSVRNLKPKLRSFCENLLEQRLAQNEEPFNFVTADGSNVPTKALCWLLGIPEADHDRVQGWSNRLVGLKSDGDRLDPHGSVDVYRQAAASAREYAIELAQHPDRGKSTIHDESPIRQIIEGDETNSLSPEQFAVFFRLLMVAGIPTMRDGLVGGMNCFLQHPEQWKKLKQHPGLLDSALDEILRYWPPVLKFRRTATRDCELRGRPIRKGDKLVLWYAAANRDPEQYENPHDFDITREGPAPVSFGGGGPHHCLGIHLARFAMKTYLETLMDYRIEFEEDESDLNFVDGPKVLSLRMYQ